MSTATAPHAPWPDFDLPAERSATEPPEARGLTRDGVRLLVATPDEIHHARFDELGVHLRRGDLLVVNTTATLPAALDGRRTDGRPVVIHVAGPHPGGDGTLVVEPRRIDGAGPLPDATRGEEIALPRGARLTLVDAHPDPGVTTGSRLWQARLPLDGPVGRYLEHHGRPIAYGYVPMRWPLASYQSVFSRDPGSAEMASAGRPFTPELVTDLVVRGVVVAPLRLHTGVSSQEGDEPLEPERYHVPSTTARLVEQTRDAGGRVVAVGTTVVRALETVTGPDGAVRAGEGWTDLVLGPGRPARVVTGLVTGWHAPGVSHLDLLEAVAGRSLVRRAYAAGLEHRYLWHEFGDGCLLLP